MRVMRCEDEVAINGCYPLGVRLVATDIDGTIIPVGGVLSPRTIAVLRGLTDAGLAFVLVTARPPRWMVPIAESLGHVGEAVCSNGAVLTDLSSGSALEWVSIPEADAIEVAGCLRGAFPDVALGVESAEGFSREPAFTLLEPGLGPHEVAPFEDLAAVRASEVVKILARVPGGHPDEMLDVAAPLLAGLVETSHSSRNDNLIEIAPRGVSKASALQAYAAKRGIGPEEVVAFGDAPNDLSMLAWAGTSYAVANAHSDVLRAATHRAPSAEDDGVAQVLEDLLGLEA